MDRPLNLQIGEFAIRERIGRGGSAEVYSALQPSVNRYVALKMISLHTDVVGDDDVFVRRFTQEAQVLASLEHPHIVPIYNFGVVEHEYAYIAMRLLHSSLRIRMDSAPLPLEHAIDIMLQLTSGLGYAHRKGVIHRDIKPSNVLFDEAGAAYLGDFGLAKLNNVSLVMTKPGTLVGTALYVSPEQVRGTNVDHRTDIYSLGVILYEMLTGQLPFDAPNLNMLSTLYKVEFEEPTPPRKINPEISPELERIIMRALRKEPRERFFDVQEMANALEKLNAALPRRKSSWIYKVMPKVPEIGRRQPVLIIGGMLVAFLLVLIVLIGSSTYYRVIAQVPTVIEGMRGLPSDAVPSAEEILRARLRIGDHGFIAYIACGLDSQTLASRAREMRDFSEAYEIPYRVYNSESDIYKQLTLIERARLEGAKAIILCPMNPGVLSESLASIQQAGIPVVLTAPIAQHVGVEVDANHAELGRLAGEHVVEMLITAGTSRPRIVILDEPDLAYSEARVQGFLDAVTSRLPDAEVVARQRGGAQRNASEAAVAALVSDGNLPDVIFSITDLGAYGAITTLEAAGIAPNTVIVASINGESVALDYIYNGYFLSVSVDEARESGSRSAIDAAVKLLGGGTIPETITLTSGIVITRDIIEGNAP